MPQLKYPTGQIVDVQFDEQAHSYVVAHQLADGKMTDYRPTHGITAPLEVVPKPFLTPWGAKLGADGVIKAFTQNPGLVDALEQFHVDKQAMESGERYIDEKGKDKPVMSEYRFKKLYPWYGAAKANYKDASQEGKDLGHWLHSSIEQFYLSGRKTLPIVDEFTEGMWDSFIQFDNFYKPVPDKDGLEFIVYSLLFGYSGMGDFRGTMNGKHCIGDWKSTNRSSANKEGISVEYFFQVGGLAQAEYERTGKWVQDLFIANFSKKGEPPRVVWASDFGMSPQDCARAYISCFNNYHTIKFWDYKWSKR